MKRFSKLLLIGTLGATLGVAFGAQASVRKPFLVVIDPGHGGTDDGTTFYDGHRRVTEKDMTLRLAIDAARELRARGYRVVLTRTGDQDVGLAQRTALANRIGANLFISIHMNSTPNPYDSEAEGVETYILNNETDASSRRLARLENSLLTAQERSTPELTDVSLILKDLRLDANLSKSKRLACAIQSQLVRVTSLARPGSPHFEHRNRGVKQALFHVLLGANMPSVLVEAGFLSSTHDRDFVLQLEGRKRIGRAIAQAVEDYRGSFAGFRSKATAMSGVSRCKVD